jgi:fructokinase
MKTATNHPPLIIGLGEVLWDLLPSGKQLGGAPAKGAHGSSLLVGGELVSRPGCQLTIEMTGARFHQHSRP